MNLTNVQLNTLLPDGTERIVRLVNMASPMDGANLLSAPLVFKVEGGAKYKLINIETGAHQKGQSLVRHNKDLKVFVEDVLAIELQDYFVASLTPAENSATYQLENASCNEVQVTSHYPLETFQIPESLTWTENDSALDCKVALFNPGSAVGLIPSATPVLSTSFGFGQIAATVIGIPVLLGGTGGSGLTPPPPTPTPPTPGPIDTTSPSLVITTNASSAKADETILVTFTFSEDIGDSFNWDGTSGDIVVTGGTLSALSGSGLVRTAIFTPTPNQTSSNAGISVKPGSYQDASGNLGLGTSSPSLSVDTTLPKLISTEITSAKDGLASLSNANIQWLNSGDTLFASATFSETIFLDQTNGSPTLQLLVGDQTVFATYQSGSGTNTLIFSTTVINGQSDTDGVSIALNALQLNGATIKDIAGNQSLISSSPVISNPNFLIDTTFPEVVVSSNVSTLKINETATVTFTFTEDPGSSFIWNGTEGDLIVSGGTLTAIEGTGLTRSAIFTPAASQLNRSTTSSDTSASITVSSASYSDAAGNTGSAGSSPSITIDTLEPSVSIASDVEALKIGETAVITFSFSEDPGESFVWDGTNGDLSVSGGTLGAIGGSGLTRTAVFTPTENLSSGTASITVTSDSYTDPAGNTGSAGVSPSITIDTLAPKVTITSDVAALKVGETAAITFTFSEDPGTSFAWNGTTGDLAVSGGTLTAISGTGLTRTAVFTPTANLSSGLASITVTSASYSDAAGNTGSAGSLPTISIDTLAPTVTITSDVPTLKVGETAAITFTFSEDPGTSFAWDGTAGDLAISGGALGAISGTGLTRTAVFIPTANLSSGSASITVTSASYSDAAGNAGSTGASPSISIDTLAPTVAITSNVATLKVDETATITFTFSEDPDTSFAWNGTAGDLAVSGGNLSAISGTGLSRTATFTPTANLSSGSASITVTSASYSDAAGNTGAAGISPSITIDTLSPTVAITSNVATLKVGETATITFTFSEDPDTSFAWNGTVGDLAVSGGTLAAISGTGLTRTAVFTPTANLSSGSASIIVTSASYSDAAGNAGSAGTSPSITIETVVPTVAITSNVATLKVGETATITFTFSEDPGTSFAWNGTAGDLAVSGGNLSAISGTGLTRTATFTPTANQNSGSASITVTSASYSDAAGNTGSASTSPSITIDTLAPTVSITSDMPTLKVGETATITFTFSEDPSTSFAWNGTAGDLTISGGTLTAISGTGLTRTAVFTPTANLSSGSASITVTSASYSDAAGNTGAAGTSPSITIDTVAPTVAITSNLTALKVSETATITFTFSEDPGTSFAWNGTAGDLIVSGGTLGAISGTGLTRTATFTPNANHNSSSASITVTSASYSDTAGNTGSAGLTPSITIDTLAPTVTITSDMPTLRVGETATITFTFSEDPGTSFAWNGTAGDLTLSGGTLSAISGTGVSRTATFTPTANLSTGSASITVTSASYGDAAGNTGSAATSPSITIDTLAPTVAITTNVATLKVGETATITFTFSEDPGTSFTWNGTAGDLTISNGTLSAISGTGLSRTATFTPTANLSSGSASITVTSASYADAAGNTGAAGTSPSITIDTVAPTVAITSNVPALKVGETATITFTFSEDPGTSFAWNGTSGDLTVLGGTLGAITGSGLIRTAVFTPTANLSSGSASITVTSASYADSAGNTGSAGTSPSITIDTLAPTVAITSNVSALKVGETATITFTFSEDPGTSFAWNGTTGDLTVSGGALGAISGTGLTRTASFTPTANLSSGSASITVTSASYTDAAGNTGGAGTSPSITIDTLAPTVTITSNVATLKVGETATITFTFSEDPGTSFAWNGTVGDLTISGGTLGAISGTGLTRTATFTPTANQNSGSASITVTSASYSDAAGNTGSAGTSPSISIDTLAPTVSITSDMPTLKVGETATITFTFSEDPGTSFAWDGTAGDLTISGGALGAISGTGLTRTATFTPTANLSSGAASITVTSSSYSDAAGNTGSAGVSPSITIDTLAPTVAITSNVAALKAGETATITFTFSEDPGTSFVWNGLAGDLTISGGTLGAISGTGLTRTAVFTPTANLSSGSASITVTSASYSDSAGNTGSAGTSPSITIDTRAPTVAIASNVATLKVGETATITFTFSEDPGTSFAWDGVAGDVTVSGGDLGAISGTGLTRTAVFTPTANLSIGSASITVSSASYSDAAGNTGAAGTSPSITIDTLAPTVAITSNVAALKVGETATITFTFSEDPGTSFAWNETTGDLAVSGGTLGVISGTGLTRTAVFTPTANLSSGSASITVTSASYSDSAGNTGSTGTSPSITIDTRAPTVAITSNVAALKVGETATITFTFSEDPGTSFAWNGTAGDLTISGGTLGDISGTGLTRTAVFTPTANLSSGSASITVTSASYSDAAGNTGSAGASPSITIDTVAPTVSITSNVAALKVGETATITFTFSEDPGTSFTWDGITGDLAVSGGSLGTISGSGLTRSATFTPTANQNSSSASITVTSASYSDSAGNAGSAGTSPSITIDTLTPTVAITSNVATLKVGETAAITFTFSEDPGSSFAWNGTAGDLTVSGGTLGAISGTGLTRTATFTPTANIGSGSGSITVTSASYSDTAGNTGSTGTSPSITIDTLAPTVSITSDMTTLKVGETATITLTFSEDPGTSFTWNGTAGDLTISGGTLSAISGTGLTRSAVFTPTANLSSGSASISVTSASYSDVAGNTGSAGTSPSISIDTAAPTVVITTDVAALKIGETATITFTFTEDPSTSFAWNGTAGDLTVSGGTLGAISGTGLTRTAVFTPTANLSSGSASITITSSSYSDAAGNTGSAGTSPSITIDTLAPTVTITSNVAALKAGQTAVITFIFSEDPGTSFVWNGTAGDLTVLGGSLGAISGTGLSRSAIFTPTTDVSIGTASISISPASYTDSAGNTGTGGSSPSIVINTLGPIVSITSDVATLKSGETATITFTFSDDPGLSFEWNGTSGDLTVLGGTLGAITGSGLIRTAVFTPTANLSSSTASITVTLASYSDAAGNAGSAGASPTIKIDTLAPTVSITSDMATLKIGETATISFTFSEDPGTSFAWNGTTGDLTISGGTLGAISGTGLTRTATFTPSANLSSGSATITVTSASYSDAAGNTGSAGATPSITIDTLAPTVAITSNVATLKVGETATITFTFSEDPGTSFAWNGTAGDLTVSGGTLGAINGTGLTRSAVFTPTANLSSGSASITVTSSSYSDAAGNIGSAGASPSITIDTVSPSVTITSNVSALKVGETATITFTFSEDPVTSFTWNGSVGDLVVTGGTLSAISGTGLTRTATFTPTVNLSNGSASITVTSVSYADAAGNTGSAGTSPSVTIDTLAPTVTVTSNVSALKAGETATITFTFSEDPGTSFAWDGTAGDIAVSGGTLGAISGTGLTRTGTFTPTANLASGSASITVTSTSYSDAAGNTGSVGTSPSINIDTVAPTVSVTSNVAALKAGETATITFTFSEDPSTSFAWNGTAGDLNVSGGTLSAISGTGLTRNAVFTPTANLSTGSASITVTSASYADSAGNTGAAGTSPSITIDTVAPTVAITSNVPALKVGETATITFTFSEDPGTSFAWNGTTGDLTISGGTLSSISGTGLTRTAVFTPTASQNSGSASITVTSASYSDASGNTGSAGTSPSITIDTLAPTVAITSDMPTLKVGETASITFTFSEDPGTSFAWNGTAGDLTISGGTLGAISGTGLTRIAVFTPTANLTNGSASITVTSASYADAAGNTGAAGTSPSITIDTVAPTVAITSDMPTLKVGETAAITFTFSEDPGTSFAWNGTAGDLTVSGGTLSAISGTGLTRTAVFTPTANLSSASASITVTSASYADAAGNTGAAGTSPSITIDTVAPTVAITSTVATLKVGETATITFTFSEDPGTSFAWNGTAGDLTVSGGTLGAISGTGLTRTASFTPTANLSSGSASITVTSASYSDAAGNIGSSGTSPSITIDTLAPTVAITSNVTTLKVGETATITFTFSEDPSTSFAWNGTAGDLTVSGGTLGAISGTGLTRTATFIPTANQNSSSASITVTSASYSDNAGNTGSAGTSPSITIDTRAPTVAITSNVAALKVGETATITFTFSEDPGTSFTWNGTAGDLTISGGTLGAISGTGLTRTAVFTPSANLSSGSASITVTSASYSDSAGNTGSAGTSPSITIDTLTPTVAITSNVATLKVGDTATITFIFSEDPGTSFAWNGTTGDLAVSGGTLTAISGTGLTRTAVFTPTANLSSGSASITVSSASYSDAAGNTGSAGTSPSITIDTLAPTVTITSNVAALKIGEIATITFTFSEDPGTSFAWNGTAGDLTVSGGTLGAISGTGLTRTATFTPTANQNSSSASITVTSATYSDEAGNTGSSGTSPSITIDTVAPTVAITSNVATLKVGETATITFTFSEDPGTSFAWNGTAGDLTVSGGTLGTISGTGLTRTAVFTPTANLSSGSASITVTSASYSDTAGNTGAAGTSPSITIDTRAPTVAITSNVATLKVGETATITFTFSEDPGTSFAWNGTTGDLTVSGGTLGAISGTGLTRNAVFTPTANLSSGSASIRVTSASYADAAGNTGAAGTSPSITIDTLAPTVSITSNVTALKVGQTATITFTFSEDPGTSFTWNGTAGDLTISGGTLSAISGTGLTRTATFTPTANLSSGSASIIVTSASYSDSAGNTGSAGTSPSITIDTLAPTVTIASNVSALKVGETATITFTFSEDPGTSFAWNGTTGDLTVSGGTLGAISGTGLTRTATFTPTANQNSSSASISVNSASYADSAGNTGSAGSSPSLNFDTLTPTISSMNISGASGIISNTLNAGDVVQITANFSESITVNATGAKPRVLLNIGGVSKYADYLSGSGTSDLVFGYTIAAGDTDANGVSYAANELQLNGGTIKDSTGNNATLTAIARSDNASYKVDTTSPSVTITSNVSTVGMGQTANITFTFSEDPGSSFTTDDVLVTQGTLSAITGSGLTRTAVFTPFADTSLTAASITVPAASFTDTAGNAGIAGTSPSLSVNTFKNAIYLDDIANNIGGYVIESPNANANFGFSVSLVGDFNGDGYGDVIVGAPLNKFTETNGTVRTESGAAVIYEGGLNTQNVPAGYSGTGQVNGRYLYNNVNQGWLGYSVAGVGDMNNDGYADALIGMPQDPDTQSLAGAYLVYGKPNDTIGSLAEYQKDITKLGSGSGLSITYPAGSGPTYRSSAGYSVSSAGDVNGDGWADMMISAVYQIVPGLGGYTGVIYVIYGSAALTSSQSISLTNVGTSVAGFVISGWQAGEKSGTSVSSAGDFNGDGKADLLVGAHLNSTGGTYAGATYVILGKSDNTAVNLANINNNSGGFVILGENSNDFSGISVSSGGDINGDGLGDLIVGAMIKNETSTTHPGKTYVVFGRTTANATIDLGQLGAGGFTIVSTDAKDSSGFNVSSAGDINGDGLADIILGARQRTESGVLRVGQSYVVYGKANTTQINLTDVANNQGGFAIIGQGTADLTGYAVSAAGDVNGDGLADLVVGAYGYDAASSLVVETGRTYIIFGSKGGPFAAGTKVDNAGTSANDTLTSTGSQTLVGGSFSAGTGNDTFIANGADVLLGGMGQDIFTVNSSMITALQNKFGAGGNTNQLAKIDGGAGIDTIRMGGTGGLNLDFSLISNTAVGNIEGASRINSIERIDLRTDTAANQITLRVADVLDMAGSNWANLSALNTLGAGGWQNWTGSLFSASGVKYHQVAIEGTSADRVNTSGWTLQAGTVKDANSIIYDVYIAANNAPAMMLVEQNITRFSVP